MRKKFKTEKQKIRDRYHGKRIPYYYWGDSKGLHWADPVPAWFRKMYNSQRRAENKRALYKLLNVRNDAPFASEKRSVRWDWW